MFRFLLDLLDRMVPLADRADPRDFQRGRLLLLLVVVMVLPMPVFVVAHLFSGSLGLAGLAALSMALEIGLLVVYSQFGGRRPLTQGFLAWGAVAVLYTSATTGGVESPVASTLVILPMLAFVLVSTRAGLVWTAVAGLGFVTLGFVDWLDLLDHTGFSFVDQELLVVVSLLVLLGYAVGTIAFFESMERKRNAEAVEARERAEAASQAKSAFLANMSHELRTPMNGVLGLVETMLAEGRLEPDQQETLRTVRESGRSLVALLNDLLDISRVESGRMQLERAPVHAGVVAQDVVALLEQRASTGVTLRVRADSDVGWGLGDPARLRQVVLNLVGNALKFTEEGAVEVVVERSDDAVAIFVSDTGIGIPDDVLPTLFEAFVQADDSTTRRFGGSGLGLAITQRLVHLMHGDITVTSVVGEGSTFRVSVPLPRCPPPTHDVRHATKGDLRPGLRVLVAEDNAVNQLVVRRMLDQRGAVVRIVADGELALAAVAEEEPDVVLMDVHMPNLDGLAATRALRQRGFAGPIVALTASALPEDRDQARAAGMNR